MLLRRVVGESMSPTLKPGDIILAVNTKQMQTGDVVVAILDGRDVIKRIEKITNHKYHLVGDNRQVSSDSRTKGAVSLSNIRGRVVWPRLSR